MKAKLSTSNVEMSEVLFSVDGSQVSYVGSPEMMTNGVRILPNPSLSFVGGVGSTEFETVLRTGAAYVGARRDRLKSPNGSSGTAA